MLVKPPLAIAAVAKVALLSAHVLVKNGRLLALAVTTKEQPRARTQPPGRRRR